MTVAALFCAYGCEELVSLARNGMPNAYVHGHQRRGISPSPEHRRKLSIARTGKPGPWLGKKMPTEARAKMSAAKKSKPLYAEHRAKISASMTGKPHPSIHHPQTAETIPAGY